MTQSKIKENRHQSVRARKYYDDYRVQLRAKMMKMRTREEMVCIPFCLSSSAKGNLCLEPVSLSINLTSIWIQNPNLRPICSQDLCLMVIHCPAVDSRLLCLHGPPPKMQPQVARPPSHALQYSCSKGLRAHCRQQKLRHACVMQHMQRITML